MPQAATTQVLADYLVTGFWRQLGQGPRSYTSDEISVNLSNLSSAAKLMARQALDAWEMVADVRFKETTGSAQINFSSSGSVAQTYPNFQGGYSANIVIGTGWLKPHYGNEVGGFHFQTYLHEIGHALGLGHGGFYDARTGGATYGNANWTNDSWMQSVMSYLDQTDNPNASQDKAYVVSPMMADILAIQKIYGAPDGGGVTAGNTLYGPGPLAQGQSRTGTYIDAFFQRQSGDFSNNTVTIYDSSGIDTVNLAADTTNQTVNLGRGTFSSVFGAKQNLAIATNTVIENYNAGSGSDVVTGNSARNVIDLGAGHDTAKGGYGYDHLLGGLGNDTLRGEGGGDRLEGQTGDDFLFGGDGGDRLMGGAGNDRLEGGAGADLFVFDGGRDKVVDFTNNVDGIQIDDAVWGGGARTFAQIKQSFANEAGPDLVLNFGNGHVLTLVGVDSFQEITNDLRII